MDPTRGKFEIEKFDGKGDFGLWKFKMLAQLEIQGLLSALEEDSSSSSIGSSAKHDDDDDGEKDKKVDPKKAEKDLRVRSLLSICLSDVILRKSCTKQRHWECGELWRKIIRLSLFQIESTSRRNFRVTRWRKRRLWRRTSIYF